MKSVILGIKDYMKDTWHDWHLHCVEKSIGNEPLFCMEKDAWVAMLDWKEGNLWHYIAQRKYAAKYRKCKS